jgi:hypothetical protein
VEVLDLLPVQLYLLAVHPQKQRITSRSQLGYVLRAGALVELQLGELIVDGERGRPQVVGRGEPRDLDPLLSPVLRQLAGSAPRSWQHWVRKGGRAMITTVRERLVRDGVIRLERVRWLGVLPYSRIVVRDPRVRKRLEAGVLAAVRDGQPLSRVEPRVAALAALAAAGELGAVLPRSLRRSAKQRIGALSERAGPVPKVLRKVVQEMQSAPAAG